VEKRSVTVRIAAWSALHPWRAILLWVLFVAASVVLGSATGVNKAETEDQAVGEAARAISIINDGDFGKRPVENVLITSRGNTLDRAEADQVAAAVASGLRQTPGVASVDAPVVAPDGKAILVGVTLDMPDKEAPKRMAPLLAKTDEVQRAHPSVRVELVGNASIQNAMDATIGKDLERAELLSIPVTLLVLLVAFGAVIAAGIPIVLALSAVVAASGLSAVASHLFPSVNTVDSVMLLIGMAVGVDYSLFYLRREREERAAGRSRIDAVRIAAETSGHAVLISGFAVIVSMAGLYLASDVVFSSLATASVLVVGVAVVGSLTVLPAFLAKIGRWVDRPRIPLLWRLTTRRGKPRFWPWVLRPALRFPAVTLILAVLALVALATPALDLRLRMPSIADLPRSEPAMQAYDRLTTAFPTSGTTFDVAVRATPERAAAVRVQLQSVHDRTATDPLFAKGDAKFRVSADGSVTVLTVATPHPNGSPDSVRALERLRSEHLSPVTSSVPRADVAVGGELASSVDYSAHVARKLPLVVAFVLLLTFLVLLVTFRSVVVAATAIVLNLLSAAAAYGLLVVVFQNTVFDNTWAENLLGFQSIDAIVSWLPLFLFVVLFGLSMDYHVFVVSRIREAVLRGLPTREAVAEGITGSAGVVTSAAIVMVAVFSIFATLSLIDMKQLGIGLAAAILIDATIIRAVVLPAAMNLLGNANWWSPRLMRRRHPGPSPATPVGSPVADVEPASSAVGGGH
jgi:RND superfamily putative drug exporter